MFKKVFLLLGGLLPVVASNATAQNIDRKVLSMKRNATDNTPILIQFTADAGWKAGQEQEVFGKYLGVDGAKTRMVQQYSTTTKSKVTTARYYEYYKGIRSEYGSFTVTIKDGAIQFISGNYYNTATDVSVVPVLTEAAAFDKAIQRMGAQKYMWENPGMEALIKRRYHNADTSYKPHGILRWVEDFSAGKGDRKMHLAYAFDIYASEPMSRQVVFVDATDGHILHANSLIKHTAAVGHSLYSKAVPMQTAQLSPNYVLFDSTRGNGVHTMNMNYGTDYSLATEITNTTTSWPVLTADSTAIDAHWGGEMVYDYWRSQQGRLSWDDLDGELTQYVHYDVNFDNAFWDGAEMSYGDGSGCGAGFTSLTSLDVTGHEIGHGVCQATANLIYESESGAINEGLSDCWGATIENWANPHEVDAVGKLPFKMGEEIGCGTPMRSMDYPHNEFNPDTYGTNDPYWVDVVGCTASSGNDECGVHTNSGVTNKWYYLVITGGSGVNANGDSYAVSGIGWTKAANILYQTELALPSTSTYADFMTISIATAGTIYGPCSPEVQTVTNAWYAVGVGTPFVPCFSQLGFTTTVMSVSEYAGSAACPAGHTVTIGVAPTGPVIAGGNPVVTITQAYGSAVAGVDYLISGSPITFPAGDMSTRYVTMTIYDNGAINDTKDLALYLTVNPMGTGAIATPGADTLHITINNDDSTILTGGPEYHTLNTGSLVTSNLTSAFIGSNRRAHSQFLLLASEMAAAGVRPGTPISQIAFNITSKSSTVPYINYTVSMANTSATDLSSSFVSTGFTTVYSGNHTTNLGTDSIDFTTNFTWDGTSNVAVNVCYGMNASAAGANDQMSGIDHGTLIVCDHNQTNGGAGTGCSLGYSGGGQSTARPVMRFKQILPASKIATILASNHTWPVVAGTTTNFINTSDTGVLATIANPTADLGCVNATLSAAGTGFTPSVFSSANRSVKEVTITPTINGPITTYDVTIYLTNTELGAVAPASLHLLKTEQPTDATVSSANSVMLTPTLVTGSTYVGFKGTFTGVNGSRFFLTDGLFCTPPTATITPAGPTTFCSGGSVVLNSSTGAGYTYQWQQGGTDIPGATNSSYTASTTGNYTVRITSFSCATTSSSTSVTVNSVTAGSIVGATSVCTGQSTTLSDATPGGVWSSGASATATVDAAGTVTGVTPGVATISYVVTNACGTATATTSMTVNASPVVSAITGTAGVCAGATTTLSDVTPAGAWSSSNAAVATVGTAGMVSGITPGTANIGYSVTNGAGCTTTQSVIVTVNALPSTGITVAGSTTICPAGSVALSGPAGAGLTYQWQLGGVNIPGATNVTYATSVAGVYGVRVTNSAGCTAVTSAGASITVIVDPTLVLLPVVTVATTPGTTFCATPTTTTFTASSVNGGTAPVYNWYINGIAAGTGTTHTYLPSAGDVVVCVLTSNAACAAPLVVADTIHMAIAAFATPLVAINPVPNDTVCAGASATFVAVPTYGGTAPTYSWKRNGINVATGPTYGCIPMNGDVIECRMVSNYTCRVTDVALSAPLAVTVQPDVSNSITVTVDHMTIGAGSAATFTAIAANPGAAPVYQWYINGTAVTGATSSTFTTTTLVDGQVVSCSVTSSNPCAYPATNYSAGISMHVSNGVGIMGRVDNLVLVPNPNNGTFSIAGTLNNVSEVNVKVVDMLGQVVYESAAGVTNGVIDRAFTLQNNVAAGMYLVHVSTASGSVVFHMAVTK